LKHRILITIIILVSSAFLSVIMPKGNKTEEGSIVSLTEWEYFVEIDTFANSQIAYRAISQAPDSIWHSFLPGMISTFENNKIVWLRTKLPAGHYSGFAVYPGRSENAYRMFFGDSLIYKLGNMVVDYDRLARFSENFVVLPVVQKNNFLYFRLKVNKYGDTFKGPVLFGPIFEIQKLILQNDIGSIFFLIFTLSGIMIALVVQIFLVRTRLIMYLILVMLFSSLITIETSPIVRILFDVPGVYFHSLYIILQLFLIGYLGIIGDSVSQKYSSSIFYMQMFNLVSLICLIYLTLFTNINYRDIRGISSILFYIILIISHGFLIMSLKEKWIEIRIFFYGVLISMLLILAQPIFGFGVGAQDLSRNTPGYMNLAIFILLASIALSAVDKLVRSLREKETLRKKELYLLQKESEIKQQFASRLIESQEAERSRIALELHDSLAQKLVLTKYQMTNIIKGTSEPNTALAIKCTGGLIDDSIQEIRDITYNLRPKYLDQLGLAAAIENIVEKVSETAGIYINLKIDNISGLLSKTNEINLFRIIQESLNNIVKHSGADAASVTIRKKSDCLVIEIRDNGHGIISENKGMGFQGMKERAEIIGAVMNIESASTGTIVSLNLNLQGEHNNDTEIII